MPAPIAAAPSSTAELIVAIPFYVAFVVGYVAIGRRTKRRSWTRATGLRDAMTMIAFLIFFTVLPVRAHAFVALLSLAVLVGWLTTYVILESRRASWVARLRQQQRRRAAGATVDKYGERVSEDVLARSEGLRTLGFEPLTTITNGAAEIALSFRPIDSILAEVGKFRLAPDQPVVAELTSVLASQHAVLVTSTWAGSRGLWPAEFRGVGPDAVRELWEVEFRGLWAGEFRQAFPGASAEYLLAEHERGLALLSEKGLRTYELGAEHVVAAREQIMRRHAAAAAETATKTLRAALFTLKGVPRYVGRLQEQPDIQERLETYWSGVRVRPAP